MSDDLVTWLRARFDEDERVATEARHDGEGRWRQTNPDHEHGHIEDDSGEVVTYDEGSPTGYQADHIARHDPAHELNIVAAHRRLLDLAGSMMADAVEFAAEGDGEFMRLMSTAQYIRRTVAAGYADRPGYHKDWRPE